MPAVLRLRELESDLAFVERQLEALSNPYDTVRLMWEQRREDIRAEIELLESKEEPYASVALLFSGLPVVGSADIRVDFATKVLDNYQAVVSALVAGQAGQEIGSRGVLPRAWTSKLYIRDIVRGSVGFLLEEPKPRQAQLLPTPLKLAVDDAASILKDLSSSQPSVAAARMASLNPRAIKALKNFSKVLRDAGAETDIASDRKELTLDSQATDLLYANLNDVEISERREAREGTILGILPDRGQYEFRPDDGQPVFYGPVSEALDARYMANPAAFVLSPVIATFNVISTMRAGMLQREERVLDHVQPRASADNPALLK